SCSAAARSPRRHGAAPGSPHSVAAQPVPCSSRSVRGWRPRARSPDFLFRIMPKRTDIQSVLIIGAGPIVIGQACEFDYSGVQACKALRQEGFRVILVNSNPATLMTDPDLAHLTYVEPATCPS